MKVLGICGSPHSEGNTAYALNYGLEIIKKQGIETEYVSLANKKIMACKGCFKCRSGSCVYQEDDMFWINKSILNSDAIILASPVWMGLITGLMKTMMDRTVLFRVGGVFKLTGKFGAGIACGGFRNGGQELTLQAMQTFFLQQDMYTIADGPPFSHSGAAIVGEAKTDTIGLHTVENLALRISKAVKEKYLP